MFQVTIFQDGGKRRNFTVNKDSATIGRAPDNDICLEAFGVSRYHARLGVSEGKVFVQDLNSTNGTFLNSKNVDRAEVASTDQISIGRAILSVTYVPRQEEEPSLVERLLGRGQAGANLEPEETFAHLPIPPQAIAPTDGPPTEPPLAEELATEQTDENINDLLVAAGPIISKGLNGPQADKIHILKSQATKSPEWPPAAPDLPELSSEDESLDLELLSDDGSLWETFRPHLGPIWECLVDDQVSAIYVNGTEDIYVRSAGQLVKKDIRLAAEQLQALANEIMKISAHKKDEKYARLTLADGAQMSVLLPPLAQQGVAVCIQKPEFEVPTLETLIENKIVSQQMAPFLAAAVRLRKNILISGNTETSRLLLVNALMSCLSETERVVLIGNTTQLDPEGQHVVCIDPKSPATKGMSRKELLDIARGMFPDRLVTYELGNEEAFSYLQTVMSDCSGAIFGVHASSPLEALTRLEAHSLLENDSLSIAAVRGQVAGAVDLIVQVTRFFNGSYRVTHISEIAGLREDGTYVVNDLFRFFRSTTNTNAVVEGRHIWTQTVPSMIEEMKLHGFEETAAMFDQ